MIKIEICRLNPIECLHFHSKPTNIQNSCLSTNIYVKTFSKVAKVYFCSHEIIASVFKALQMADGFDAFTCNHQPGVLYDGSLHFW